MLDLLALPAVVLVGLLAVDRLLRVGERRGILIHPRNWSAAGVGNALLELQIVLQPDRSKIEMTMRGEAERVGDGRGDNVPPNVIPVDFARRRKR